VSLEILALPLARVVGASRLASLRSSAWSIAVGLLTACATPSLDGTWVCDETQPDDNGCWATVTLEEKADGSVAGTWLGEWGPEVAFRAHRIRGEVVGRVESFGELVEFRARVTGDRLVFISHEERLALRRVGAREAGARPTEVKRSP